MSKSLPSDQALEQTYTSSDRPFDVSLAVRVPVMAQSMEQTERRAFEGVTEMICRMLATEASERQRDPPREQAVFHFSEVAVRVLNQMSADKRAAQAATAAETVNEAKS